MKRYSIPLYLFMYSGNLMVLLKVFHVLCVFVWVGNLVTLTGLLGYFPKEDEKIQLRLAQICKKIYLMVNIPSLVLVIITGLFLLPQTKFGASLGWFHMKLTFVVLLIVCDLIAGRFIQKLQFHPAAQKSLKYKILHAATVLCLIGILCSIYLVRNKEMEIRSRIKQELNM
ncbi:MAG: CopD family protein [Chlamydiales bacterium]|nr:CopD family protein [Chlamydiales bacterium]